MPFIPHTPESLLPRSDSKNPAATCRGLTSTGRPCRRAIARPSLFSRAPGRIQDPDAYCWQHKDQAARVMSVGIQSETIMERTSIDTIFNRLGLAEVPEGDKRRKKQKENLAGDLKQSGRASRPQGPQPNRKVRDSEKHKVSQIHFSLFCCVGVPEDDMVAPRPVRVQEGHHSSTPKMRQSISQPMQETSSGHMRPGTSPTRPPNLSQQRPSTLDQHKLSIPRPSLSHNPSSRTVEYLSLIPATTTPQTTAFLLAELAKPVSIHDEHGYIYIFWLTPTSLSSAPPPETTSSLLAPPSRPADHNRRRTSEVLQAFSTERSSTKDDADRQVGAGGGTKRTILLKIGRASNVQRRLNEWTRQCGHNLSLIRYYPYNSSSRVSSSSPGPSRSGTATPTTVPHVHKIERLIHIELADRRARDSGRCMSCGSAHREWFEVEATREGVKAVDEVVRRWVRWGMGEDGG